MININTVCVNINIVQRAVINLVLNLFPKKDYGHA